MVSIVSDQLEASTVVLYQYEQWEADLIIDDDAWGVGEAERALPTLTQDLLDRLIEIQGPREEAIRRMVTKGKITINRARRLLNLPKLDTAADAAECARATAGAVHEEVYGPCILDERGEPLIAVDHLAEDAEGIRDRMLEALRSVT